MDVAVISLRSVRAVPWYGGLVQAEDVLVRCLGARLHAVELGRPRYARPPIASPHVHRALALTRLGHPYRLDPPAGTGAGPNGRADVAVLVANDLHDVSMLLGVRDWNDLGEVVLVHIAEISPRDLKLYPEVVRHLCHRADYVFTGTEGLEHERRRRQRGEIRPHAHDDRQHLRAGAARRVLLARDRERQRDEAVGRAREHRRRLVAHADRKHRVTGLAREIRPQRRELDLAPR